MSLSFLEEAARIKILLKQEDRVAVIKLWADMNLWTEYIFYQLYQLLVDHYFVYGTIQ